MGDLDPWYVAFDPGKRTGWATFAKDGTLLKRGSMFEDELFIFLEQGWPTVKHIIIERFRIYPSKADKLIMNSLQVIEIIGALRFAAFCRHWEVTLQEPQEKDMPLKWMGYFYSKKSHVPDDKSAHAHGVKYLEKAGVITINKIIGDKERYEARN